MALRLVLAAALLAAARGATQFETRVQSGLAALFTFKEGQYDLAAATAADVSDRRLLGDLGVVPTPGEAEWMDDRPGIFFPSEQGDAIVVESLGTIQALKEAFVESGEFSVEVWIESADLTQRLSFLSFGDISNAAPCGTYDFFVGQDRSVIDPSTTMGTRCVSTGSFDPITLSASHVVVSFEGPELHIDVNAGFRTTIPIPEYDVSVWNDTYTVLLGHLNPNQGTELTWQGKILTMAIYDRALNETEVQRNFDAFLPNARPVVEPMEPEINEDETTMIPLTGTDFDVGDDAAFVFSVTSLPSNGTAFQRIGAELVEILDTPQVLINPEVHFRADADQFGTAYAAIGYAVSDGVETSREALITVDVLPVNDPPVAGNRTLSTPQSVNGTVTLGGSDIDDADIASVTIEGLPSAGQLYRLGVNDSLILITEEDLPLTLPDGARDVVYEAAPLVVGDGEKVIFTDTIMFSVSDPDDEPSVAPGVVDVSILNDLNTTDVRHLGREDQTTVVEPAGLDQRGEPFEVIIVTLPENGTLTQMDDTPITAPDTRVTDAAGRVQYTGEANLFGDNFDLYTYRIARISDGRTSAASAVMIDVGPENDAPEVIVPAEPFTGVELKDIDLTGVRIEDIDPDLYEFEVEVSVSNRGAVSFGIEVLDLNRLTFTIGDGSSDPVMVFSGLRPDINMALASMRINPLEAGVFEVSIEVNDQDPFTPKTAAGLLTVEAEADKEAGGRKVKGLPPGVTIGLSVASIMLVFLARLAWKKKARRRKMQHRAAFDGVPLKSRYKGDSETLDALENLLCAGSHEEADGSAELVGHLATFNGKDDKLARALIYIYEVHGNTSAAPKHFLELPHHHHDHNGKGIFLLMARIEAASRRADSAEAFFEAMADTLMRVFARLVGLGYLFESLASICEDVTLNIESLGRARAPEYAVDATAERCLNALIRARGHCPKQICALMDYLDHQLGAKFPEKRDWILGRFMFGEFVCEALNRPEEYLLLRNIPPKPVRKHLWLVSQLLMHTVDGRSFTQTTKTKGLLEMSQFVEIHRPKLLAFGVALAEDGKSSSNLEAQIKLPAKARENSLAVVFETCRRDLAKIQKVASPALAANLEQIVKKGSKGAKGDGEGEEQALTAV